MNLIFLIAFVTVVMGDIPLKILTDPEFDDAWEIFKIKYKKVYDLQGENGRRQIFESNLKKIQKHNIKYDLGQSSYTLGINSFADLTHEEFKDIYLSYGTIVTKSKVKSVNVTLNVGIPDTVNWVEKGYVTNVKNQGQCGSCWAFSTTGSMEGQYFRKKKHLVSFSEQQLVDCSDSFGNMGCNGGLMSNAFKYIKKYGLEKEKDYPYTAEDGECAYRRNKAVAKCIGYKKIITGSESDLANKLATIGPISVAIDASHSSFQLYKGGVYDEEDCSSISLDHGVLAVGYGTDSATGEKYWLVKNSWGQDWGLKGYIMMSKDRDNQCGIATMASYPVL